jgi:hypothetical protein
VATQRTALVILGMHRSGTSSLAGLVARLGVALGDDLLEANEWNPLGYGEHREVVERHDALLRSEGLSWDSARAPGLAGAAASDARAAFAAILERDFAGAALFALKDPRMCRALPLWREAFEAAGVEPRYAVVLRHPLEIAASLARRDGFELSRCLLLWASHMIAAERETRGAARSFVEYGGLMSDWRGVSKRLASDLRISWPRDAESAAPEIESYLSRDLRHHTAPEWPAGDAARFPWAVCLHDAMSRLAGSDGEESRAAVDAAATDWTAAAALYEPELAAAAGALAAARSETGEANRARRKAERKLAQLADRPTLWLRTYLRRRLRRERQ